MITPSDKYAIVFAICNLFWPSRSGFTVGKLSDQCTRSQMMHRKPFAVINDIFTISITNVCVPSKSSSAYSRSVQVATYIPGITFREAINVAELPLIVYLSSGSVSSSFPAMDYAHIAVMNYFHVYIQGNELNCSCTGREENLDLVRLVSDWFFVMDVISCLPCILREHASSKPSSYGDGEYYSRCSSCWNPLDQHTGSKSQYILVQFQNR